MSLNVISLYLLSTRIQTLFFITKQQSIIKPNLILFLLLEFFKLYYSLEFTRYKSKNFNVVWLER